MVFLQKHIHLGYDNSEIMMLQWEWSVYQGFSQEKKKVTWELVDENLIICVCKAKTLICLLATTTAVLCFFPSSLSICCLWELYVCIHMHVHTLACLCLSTFVWPCQDLCSPEVTQISSLITIQLAFKVRISHLT